MQQLSYSFYKQNVVIGVVCCYLYWTETLLALVQERLLTIVLFPSIDLQWWQVTQNMAVMFKRGLD